MYKSTPKPVITISPSSTDPARKQVADQIRSAIVEGFLSAGDELPSVRRLGIDLGVHFNTIAEAYRTLASEGWLEIAQGRGARVQSRPETSAASLQKELDFGQRLRHLVSEMRAGGIFPDRIREMMLTVLERNQ